MAGWTIRLLGGEVLTGPSGEVFAAKHQESLRLIKFVASFGTSGVSSNVVMTALYESKWDDPQNGLRTQLARTNRLFSELSGSKLLERVGDKIRFTSEVVLCDLWEIQNLCEASSAIGDDSNVQIALAKICEIDPESLHEALQTEFEQSYSERLAATLLTCLRTVALVKSASAVRLKLVQLTSTIRPFVSQTSVNVESLLKLYAATQCRQEVLQTYLDYEAHLGDDLGEQPATRISELCESLLRQLEGPRTSKRLGLPSKPEATFGRETLREEAKSLILGGGKVYVGGVPGVGKSHFMREVVTDRSLSIFQFCWIDLVEESLDDLSTILPETPADVVILDGYSAAYADTVKFIEQICRFHTIVAVGSTPVGFDYTDSLTVRPLEAGTESQPGPATLFLESLIGNQVLPSTRESTVFLAKLADGLPFSIKLVAGLAKTFGVRAVAAQFEANPEAHRTSNEFLRLALEQTLSQFEPTVRQGVVEIAAFGERVPLSMCQRFLGLDIWKLKRLADAGLLSFNSELMEVRAPQTITDHIHATGEWANSVDETLSLEERVLRECISGGVIYPREETLVSHLRVYFRIVKNLTVRGNARSAIELLSALRPHAFALPDGTVDPAELEATFWEMNIEPELFAKYALGIGTLYILRLESADLEKFVLRLLADPRLCQAPLSFRIEIYSQFGLALRLEGRLAESEHIFEVALGMLDSSCLPSLELKLLHNKSITLAIAGKFDQALETKRAAIKLAEFAPNDSYRVELLHMEAVSMWEAGYPEGDVKASLLVALAYARMYKLETQQGWILQNANKLLAGRLDHAQSVLLGSVGIGLQSAEGLLPEVRRLVKGTCEILFGCLTELKLNSLALEAKLLSERMHNGPLPSLDELVCHRSESATFQVPFSLMSAPVGSAELNRFVATCIRSVAHYPSIATAIDEWGLDLSLWIDLELDNRIMLPFAVAREASVG